MSENPKIAVLGGGSWATAIVKILTNNVPPEVGINWYIRDAKAIEIIERQHHNPNYLSSVNLDTKKYGLTLYNDINEAISNSEILIVVIPSAFIKKAFENVTVSLRKKYVVSAVKGIIPEENLIVSDFFYKRYKVPMSALAVVSGPCHAEEVALERLSYLTVGSKRRSYARTLATLFECRYIKTRTSRDIYGIEYSAVLKNIYALAAGICHGLGYGDNFQAVLISNAMQEIRKFVKTVQPIKESPITNLLKRLVTQVKPFSRNLNTSAYLGDLLVTGYSQFSRNRTFGMMIGKGYSVQSAQLEMNMIAEGYYATKCIMEINKNFNVEMPITEAVYNILYKNCPPLQEIELLCTKLR